MPLPLDYTIGLGALALGILYFSRNTPTSKLPLPPGPPRWPLIGAVLSVPRDEPNWTAFVRWGREAGTILKSI